MSTAWLDRALALVSKHEVSFYDAACHALALESGGVFVTADERYVARAGRSGAVVLLTQWRL